MGRTGHPARWLIGAAAIAVAAAGTGVSLSRAAPPLAQAATRLRAAVDTVVVGPDGGVTPAVEGERIAAGEVVRTGAGGAAELVTRSRTVYVESSAAVAVLDGAQQQLRAGAVVVDAQRGSGLRLDIDGAAVSVPGGSAVEAERSVTVTVGALAGPTTMTSAAGRVLRIPVDSEASVDGAALPGRATPLRLSDDAAESRAVPRLVSDDITLRTVAAGIDAAGAASATAVAASWPGVTAPVPATAGPGEATLPVVIADATDGNGGAQRRYDRVVAFRAAGGSWGPILDQLGGRSAGVLAELTSLQRDLPVGRIGPVAAQEVAASPAAPPPAAAAATGPSGDRSPMRGTGSRGTQSPPATPPVTPPAPSPSPSPTPSPTAAGPVAPLLSGTTRLVHRVLTLVPLPAALPTELLASSPSARQRRGPASQPSPSGPLSGLLGHH